MGLTEPSFYGSFFFFHLVVTRDKIHLLIEKRGDFFFFFENLNCWEWRNGNVEHNFLSLKLLDGSVP